MSLKWFKTRYSRNTDILVWTQTHSTTTSSGVVKHQHNRTHNNQHLCSLDTVHGSFPHEHILIWIQSNRLLRRSNRLSIAWTRAQLLQVPALLFIPPRRLGTWNAGIYIHIVHASWYTWFVKRDDVLCTSQTLMNLFLVGA